MHRFELKQVAELLWKNATTKEEKTPIISNSTRVPDSGSITKEANMNGSVDSKLGYDRKLLDAGGDSCDDNSDSPPKMTLLRKLCFVLSLNGGIVYVAALLWWIPCKHPLCLFLTNWTMNMSYPLTTNMEIKSTDLSYSYFLGYADDDGGRLASLQMKTGAMMWNVSTEVILHNIFCNLNIPSDGNNEVPDCIGTSYNYIMAFNSTKGNIVWERNVEDPSDLMVNQVSSSTNGSSIMVFSDRYLLMIDAKNGTHLSTRYLPCSWNNGVKVLGPLAADNSTLWTIVCEYGDSIEVWTFREEELLLDLPAERASSNGFFRFLFSSRGSSDGSIDLSGDVTRTPDTLALSWADSVAMVTHQAPFHHLRKTWERHFGDPLIVTGIASGYFTSKKEIQIAIALLDGQNSTLHILETNNGTSETVANLGLRSIMSMKTIVGVKGDADTILIESMSPYGSDGKNSSNSLSENTRHFFTIKYTKKGFVFKDVVMAEVYASSLNQFAEGSANLLIASGDPDAGTSIKRYIIMSDLQDPCD